MATAPQLLSLPRHSRVPYTSPYAYRSLRVASAPQPLYPYRSLSIHTAASMSSMYRSLSMHTAAAIADSSARGSDCQSRRDLARCVPRLAAPRGAFPAYHPHPTAHPERAPVHPTANPVPPLCYLVITPTQVIDCVFSAVVAEGAALSKSAAGVLPSYHPYGYTRYGGRGRGTLQVCRRHYAPLACYAPYHATAPYRATSPYHATPPHQARSWRGYSCCCAPSTMLPGYHPCRRAAGAAAAAAVYGGVTASRRRTHDEPRRARRQVS